MEYITYGTAKQKVERDLDMQGEDFVDDDEMMAYFNAAIDEAEAIIQDLYEDYFLTSAYLTLVEDTAAVTMPTNMFAMKIRKVFWKNGTTERYEILPIKLEDIDGVEDGDDYRYNLENDSADAGVTIVFYPAPRETTSTKARVWYIRNANKVTSDSSKIDIPEFINYIYAYVKRECMKKELHPGLGLAISEVEKQEQKMRNTLKTRVLDGNTFIEADTSFYEDFGGTN